MMDRYTHLAVTKFAPITAYLLHLDTDSPVMSTSHVTFAAGVREHGAAFADLVQEYFKTALHDPELRPKLDAG